MMKNTHLVHLANFFLGCRKIPPFVVLRHWWCFLGEIVVKTHCPSVASRLALQTAGDSPPGVWPTGGVGAVPSWRVCRSTVCFAALHCRAWLIPFRCQSSSSFLCLFLCHVFEFWPILVRDIHFSSSIDDCSGDFCPWQDP